MEEYPIVLDTDVNGAAPGEYRWGAGQGVENLLYITVGTGIGVGVIIHGRPLHNMTLSPIALSWAAA